MFSSPLFCRHGEKITKAVSAAAENRAVKAVQEVAASRAWERLQEKLEAGGEPLINKVLNFLECNAAAEPEILDPAAPFRRNLSKFGDLQLKELKYLLQLFHGLKWAENICRRVRLASARSLVCWALGVEFKESLPGTNFEEVGQAAAKRYLES